MNDTYTSVPVTANREQELVARLLKEVERISVPIAELGRGSRGVAAPVSFAQQRLWFLEQLAGGLPLYNVVLAVRLKGRFAVSVFERALSEIVRRHTILGTTFRMVGEHLVQMVGEAPPFRLSVVDLCELPDYAREPELQRLASKEARLGFDLAQGPLLRVSVLRSSEEEHLALVVMHHIVTDGWSSGLLLKELGSLYNAFLRGERSPLPELPIQYSDFAVLQRSFLRGQELEDLVGYWRERLSGAPALLALPTDHPRPAVQSFRGATQFFLLPQLLNDRLKILGQQEGATLFMTMLAAFEALLFRYTSQTDIVVGTPAAGRDLSITENLIGCFVNTLLLRTDLSGEPTFRELLRRVREVVLEAFEYDDAPLEKIMEDLQPERDLSLSPLFQVMLVMQNTGTGSIMLPNLDVTPTRFSTGTSKLDLTLIFEETPDGLSGVVEYSTDLFEAATATRMLKQFEHLLEGVTANPDERITLLPLMSEREERQVLYEWNDTRTDYGKDALLHELFEVQANAKPNAIAVIFDSAELSYRELNARANQLARHLRCLGVEAESRVGVLMDRSFEMVVALLGVLKAGGAYVPLNPEYPSERVAFMLEDARVEVLLTQQEFVSRLPRHDASTICLDSESQAITAHDDRNLHRVASDENLAYVIYTSGSTGRPKGAMNTHAGVVNRLHWMQDAYRLDETDCVLQKTPFSFDVSVWEFFWPLMTGTRLVVARPNGHRDAGYLKRSIIENNVTTLHFVPTMLQLFLEEAGIEDCTTLRRVICSGESLGVETQERFFARLGHARLYNLYGPTEASIDVTHWTCLRDDGRHAVPIGCPIANTQIHILDDTLQPTSVGVAGELHIGGRGLGRGYLGRQRLTASAFIPNPFSREHGARLYRTGDLARYLPDGNIEFLGRRDNQVKLRGFRIDLGEIETVLAAHPQVCECVVMLREEPAGQRLVAYTTFRHGAVSPPTSSELRGFLNRQLADYMLPAQFVTLEKLPLTNSGKVDRRALPDPPSLRANLTAPFATPRNGIEEVLVAVWAEVLSVEQVGIDDNFFELGGDSIRSVRLLALARERGLHVSLQQLFQHQTIRELSVELRVTVMGSTPSAPSEPFALVRAEDRARFPDDVEDAFPLTMMQAGMLYHMAYMPDHVIYHNVYSFHLRTRFDLQAFREAVRLVVARHPMLRTSFDLTSYSEPLQLVHKEAFFPLDADDISDLSRDAQEETLDAYVEQEKWRRFDVTCPPLVRFHFHVRSPETVNFTFSECHPIVDGWSLHSLLAEVFNNYFALLDQHAPPEFKPLVGSYGDFVRLERQALESPEQKRFWEEKLTSCTANQMPRWPVPSLPEGAPKIRKQSTLLSVELSEQLRRLARTLKVPLKSVLLAAHVKAMGLLSGQQDVLTGLVSVGRVEEGDGDSVLGLFFNTLPFRMEVAKGSWADLIRDAFRNELESLPYRRYPLAAIQRERGRKPLFENVFNYLHFHVLDDVFESGKVELIGSSRAWEETNFPFSVAFMLPSLSSDIQLMLSYDATRFSDAQVASIDGYFKKILRAMVQDSSARHDSLIVMSETEVQQALVEWNETQTDFGPARCVHRLFEEQAQRTPDALAVVCDGESLTFRELNTRANRLAHHLLGRGVGLEVPVAVCLERSTETIVCMLGILKAGGVYVPLEPSDPKERVAGRLEEARAHLLLTHRGLAGDLRSPAEVLLLGEERESISSESDSNPPQHTSPESLAYVFFTSGSTGRPKGVAIEQRSLYNYVRAIVQRFDFGSGASYAMISNFATDLAHTVIFPALCGGGCLHVLTPEQSRDALKLAEYFEQHTIDYLKIVPTHLSALLTAVDDSAGRVLPRRRLILGGEASSWVLVDKVRERAPHCAIDNHYGPTETTVGVLTYSAEPDSFGRSAATLPLGRPLANMQAYILDANMNPVPPTVTGELYIGGSGVARGYFNRPGLTAESFVPDPFYNEPGARLYRTGDLARYLPDGNIEFLGRSDNQVKIRGHRIELGEIEAVLRQHPSVREAAATVVEEAPESRLVAYVTFHSDADATASELRAFLRSRLSDFMVPSSIVPLSEFPVTPNGKRIHSALPRPEFSNAESQPVYAPPQSELEHVIAALWQEALQLERVSVEDNFFDLGGHSLVLLQVQGKLRETLRRDVSIIEMFEHPTVGSLARHLGHTNTASPSSTNIPQPVGQREEVLRRRSRLRQIHQAETLARVPS